MLKRLAMVWYSRLCIRIGHYGAIQILYYYYYYYYGIVEFNVPFDTVYAISETT